MDRKKFKNLNDESRIEWIFEKYKEGYTTADIVKLFDIPKNTIGDTMRRNGLVANRFSRKYEFIEESRTAFEQGEIEGCTFSPIDDRDELLDKLIKWYQSQRKKESEVEEIHQWVKKQIEKEKEEIIKPKADRNKLLGDMVMEPMTVYGNVLQEFNEFCEKQELSKQDLLSMCMIEYMEKYK